MLHTDPSGQLEGKISYPQKYFHHSGSFFQDRSRNAMTHKFLNPCALRDMSKYVAGFAALPLVLAQALGLHNSLARSSWS